MTASRPAAVRACEWLRCVWNAGLLGTDPEARCMVEDLCAYVEDGTMEAMEAIPPGLLDAMAALRANPGKWLPVMGWRDPHAAERVAGMLGVHPDAAGFAWAVSDGVVSGCYYGVAPGRHQVLDGSHI